LLIFHNVVTMSKAPERLAAEGHALEGELIASISCASPECQQEAKCAGFTDSVVVLSSGFLL
jgi:hypothetical protein